MRKISSATFELGPTPSLSLRLAPAPILETVERNFVSFLSPILMSLSGPPEQQGTAWWAVRLPISSSSRSAKKESVFSLSQRSDLDRRPILYERIALPLSYAGTKFNCLNFVGYFLCERCLPAGEPRGEKMPGSKIFIPLERDTGIEPAP